MVLRGINHVVLKIRNLGASDAFYRGVLGLERVGERGPMWFYTAGAHHHDLGLVEVGRGAIAPPNEAVGLFHLCFDVVDEKSLAQLYEKCRDAGVYPLGSVDHNIMRSFYVSDPDGNVIELGVDIPKSEWKDKANAFETDRPYSISTYGSYGRKV